MCRYLDLLVIIRTHTNWRSWPGVTRATRASTGPTWTLKPVLGLTERHRSGRALTSSITGVLEDGLPRLAHGCRRDHPRPLEASVSRRIAAARSDLGPAKVPPGGDLSELPDR